LAERLKALGYDSSAVGKWHLGDIKGQRPTERGFSEFYGSLQNPGSYFTPKLFIDSRISPDPIKMETPGFYTTDAYTDRSVEWITKHHDKPWFLYLAYNAVHAPYDATKKYLDRFPNIKDKQLRAFTALFSALDDGVGRVMKALKDTGQYDNTIVFFISDNGSPYRDAGMNGPLRGYKWETWEGGIRVPFMMSWPGKLPAGVTYNQAVINLDVMPTVVVAAGGKVDPTWGLDGVDLMPYITGKNDGRPNPELDWRLDGRWAARVLDLKLVHMPDKADINKPDRDKIKPPELFDLSKDIGEIHNLAPGDPQDVQRLKAQWDAWNSKMAPAPLYEHKPKNKKNATLEEQ
jgi:arylsulfatase A-like enzyme